MSERHSPPARRSGSRVLLAACMALALGLLPALPALALTAAEIDAGARAAQRTQNEQQERLQQQFREDALRRQESQSQEIKAPPAPNLPKTGVCRQINEIVLSGVTLLSKSLQEELVAPYVGKCLYASDIEKLLSEVLKAYMDRGYIAVRPYVQAQDLSKGRLEILIVEGKIEQLLLKDEGWHSVNLATAFPFVKGKPLNLRDIEQGVDQLNRLASNSATMEISPGTTSGESVVTITNKPSFPASFSATMDNLGGLTTGRYQGAYTLAVDHPFFLNDYLTYTHRQTLFEDQAYRDSASNSFFYSVPFGYWTLQASYGFSKYTSPVHTLTGDLVSRGTSETWRAELNYVLHRDQDGKLMALMAINGKASKNYLSEEFLAVSSRNLAVLDADVNWNRRFPGFVVNLGLGLSKGLTEFNAKNDELGKAVTGPHAQGAKLRYTAGINVPFVVFGQALSFSSQVTGQYGLETLYGSEQINIGSFYTVRGFNRSSLSGDRGWYVRNELTTSLPEIPYIKLTPRPFVAFDGGRIEGFKTTRDANFTGMAGGLRLASKHLTGELSVAKGLSVPLAVPHEPAQFAATVTVNF